MASFNPFNLINELQLCVVEQALTLPGYAKYIIKTSRWTSEPWDAWLVFGEDKTRWQEPGLQATYVCAVSYSA